MSIRNLTESNGINIQANNLYSRENAVNITRGGQVYTIDTINPTALFTRVGDFITCSGNVDITFPAPLVSIDSIFIYVQIIIFDDNFTGIDNVRLLGGEGNNILTSCISTQLSKEGNDGVRIRFKGRNTDDFIESSSWQLSFSFSYKQVE